MEHPTSWVMQRPSPQPGYGTEGPASQHASVFGGQSALPESPSSSSHGTPYAKEEGRNRVESNAKWVVSGIVKFFRAVIASPFLVVGAVGLGAVLLTRTVLGGVGKLWGQIPLLGRLEWFIGKPASFALGIGGGLSAGVFQIGMAILGAEKQPDPKFFLAMGAAVGGYRTERELDKMMKSSDPNDFRYSFIEIMRGQAQ